MFGLSHLFYPWGILLQILALVHFVKRRPETYWLWIILIGGPIGASAYLLVEAAPDARLLGGVFQGFGRRSRIQKLESDILDKSFGWELRRSGGVVPGRKEIPAGAP